MIASLDKLSCIDYVDFGKNGDRFGRLSWSQTEKNDTKYIEIQLKVFRKDVNGEFRKHQQINLGETDFKQLLLLRNQIVVATVDFAKDEKLEPIVTAPLSKDLDEQLKHVQKAITIVDRSKRKIIATMKKYYVEKPESAYVQIRLFTRKTETEKFQQIVFVNYKLDEFLFLLDVINNVSEQALSNQSLCNIV